MPHRDRAAAHARMARQTLPRRARASASATRAGYGYQVKAQPSASLFLSSCRLWSSLFILLLADLLEPLFQVRLVLLLELGIARRSVDLARLVLAFVELLPR